MKKQFIYPWVILFEMLNSQANSQMLNFTSATPTKVQIYFDGAEIQQVANVHLPKGSTELVITNIANYLDENSIQIKSNSDVTILSVQFSNQDIEGYKPELVPEAAKPIYDNIQSIEKEIHTKGLLKTTISKSIELLDANRTISGQAMTTSELSKLLNFYKAKRYELDNQLKNIEKEIINLREKLNQLKFQLRTSFSQNTKRGCRAPVPCAS